MYNVAVIAGGDSGEYEISLKTADNIFNQLDRKLFNPYLIHFKGSDWSYTSESGLKYAIDKNDFSLHIDGEHIVFDVAFIAIHGTPGENGKLQGYFEMIGQPYTGWLASGCPSHLPCISIITTRLIMTASSACAAIPVL